MSEEITVAEAIDEMHAEPEEKEYMTREEVHEELMDRMFASEPEEAEEESSYSPATDEELEDYSEGTEELEEPGFENETTFLQSEMNRLQQEYAQVDWDTLQNIDPQEFKAKEFDFQQRFFDLNNNIEKVQLEQTAKQEREFRNYMAKETAMLHRAIPEWQNKDVMRKEKAEMRQYMKSIGYSDNDIKEAGLDHRLAILVRDGMIKNRTQSQTRNKNLPKLTNKPKISKEKQQQIELNKERKRRNILPGTVDDIALQLLARAK